MLRQRYRRLASVLARVALVLGSVLVVLSIAEICVRLAGLDPALQVVRPSAVKLPQLTPSQRSYDAALDQRALVEIRTNAAGLRDYQHSGSERTKILGLGDSFTFGFGVELEETYLSVAERELWERAPEADAGFYKIGFNGSSQYVQLAALRARFDSIRPRLVVIGFSEDTDIDENVVQDPLLRRLLEGQDPLEPSPIVARDLLHRHSALVRFFEARRVRDGVAPKLDAFQKALASWGVHPPDFDALVRTGWQRRFIGAFGEKLDAEWQVTEVLLDDLRRLVEGSRAELVLFRVPSRYSVDPAAWSKAVRDNCGSTPEAIAATCGRLDPDHTVARLRGYAERHRLLYVDPGSALKVSIAAGEHVYFRQPEIHWTRIGHERAGRVLADALIERLGISTRAKAPALPAKPRRFAAFWSPLGSPGAASFIPAIDDRARARSQTLLWAEEARIDFLVVPLTFTQEKWSADAATTALLDTIVDRHQKDLARIAVAFLARASAPVPRRSLDLLLNPEIERIGAAYARICGRPLLFVEGDRDVADERFTILRVPPIEAASDASSCAPEPRLTGDGACRETASVRALCVGDVMSGRGFADDPDLIVARFNGTPAGIEPRPPGGRLATALVSDTVARWKRGENGGAPSARAAAMYRAWLPFGRDETSRASLAVTSPAFSCEGCFPIEKDGRDAFVWTGERAEISLYGLAPGKRYRVTVRFLDTGVSSRLQLAVDGDQLDFGIAPGEITWPRALVADPQGALRWSQRVATFRPRDRTPGSTDDRLLGVAIGAVRVAAE
jgi:hypothetical protein